MSKAVLKDVLPMAKAFLGTHEVLTAHVLEFAAVLATWIIRCGGYLDYPFLGNRN
jgi:hypothetical protein